MDFNLIEYPSSEFFKFGSSKNSVDILDETIKEEINKGISIITKELLEGISSPYYYWASGNAIIICFFNQDDTEDVFSDNNYFTVIVAKNYESADLFLGELKEKNEYSFKLDEILKKAKIGDTINYNGFHLVIKDKEDISEDETKKHF